MIDGDTGFGVANLPYGVFSSAGRAARVGARLGDTVIDLAAALDDSIFARPSLNPFMAQGPGRWAEVRARLTDLVTRDAIPASARHPLTQVTLHLPIEVADYVDFYASEHHATTLGTLFRPGSAPLPPNWRHLPIGYHGRAGTVVVSGTGISRPAGQWLPAPGEPPRFGPSRRLDIEAEVGFVVGVPAPHGKVGTADLADYVFGAVLVNDWSARDIQAWEYTPLGPFLGKSFATSISPWVVPLAALEHARVPTPVQQPEPLPYLWETGPSGYDIRMEVVLEDHVISRPPYAQMYWSPAQMLAHMTVNGAGARTGDLFASGTVSGPDPGQRGALIELTHGGANPLILGAQTRTWLEDGDEVVIRATAPGPGGETIGFGEVRGRIQPCPASARTPITEETPR
ncbi:fumarylacetoacetase [Nocardia cyriacigeorgica]|uniref:fumarylacetoacetase n=1 Tax=Nocardia cyriacigeorgica TaxID=135487 RepID=UPI0024548DA1|nr:fumarylacetoacetase [Nocardia cyriacigeorgica]